MANSFVVVQWYNLPRLLLSALLKGKMAKGAVHIAELNSENRVSSLQGLALVALGFMLQFAGVLLQVCDALGVTR